MIKVLIFAGTTEGRQLATVLSENGVSCIVCVATEYGKQTMPELEKVDLRTGRLSPKEMAELIAEEKVAAVVDATHPFAMEVSRNIRESVGQVPYIRLKRDTGHENTDNVRVFESIEECVNALRKTQGRILLTTGSKELLAFCQDKDIKDRLVVRVLPGMESLELCHKAGIPGARIIAMQGPFSKEINRALIKQYDIQTLVTKESGRAGGLTEKLEAAAECGIETLLIGNPDREEGFNQSQVLEKLSQICHRNIEQKNIEQKNIEQKNIEYKDIEHKARINIALVGIGMGDENTLTQGGRKCIKRADYIFGAQRLLDSVSAKGIKRGCYLAKDILPELNRLENTTKEYYVTILFSGDVGFYSGCTKLRSELEKAGYTNIQVEPGISSIVYMSAKIGLPWQNGKLFSTHGKDFDGMCRGQIKYLVKHNPYVHVITSGLQDVKGIADMLEDLPCRIWVGCNLSYENEQIFSLDSKDWKSLTDEGLYTLIICNDQSSPEAVASGLRDEEFIRDKVPMTKEEIRAVSIRKLGLCQGAVVYDVGSGTGSIAIEMATASPTVKVYAIEQKTQAVQLIKENCRRFDVSNVEVIQGKAPEALRELETPGYAFIGGSSGNLKEIIQLLYEKNNKMRVVINAISLQTIQEAFSIIQEELVPLENYEVVQMAVSRNRKAGSYDLMTAENPVYIFSLNFKE